jgi:hypothetical protein
MLLHQLVENTTVQFIHAVAEEFVKAYDSARGASEWGAPLSQLKDESGSCSMVSHTFSDWLEKEHGVKSTFIVGEVSTNNKWPKPPSPEPDAHTVTLIGNIVVDFTAQQFDKSLPFPRIMTLGDFKKEWQLVS